MSTVDVYGLLQSSVAFILATVPRNGDCVGLSFPFSHGTERRAPPK